MNFKLLIILIAAVGGVYSLIINIVKYRSANNPTPANIADVYDSNTYEKWKKYSAEHNRLSLVSGIAYCLLTVVMLATNVYSAFASLFPNDVYAQVFPVILIEVLAGTVIGIVESYISNMVIEQRYGFNRTSIKTFIGDCIRRLIFGLMLSLALAYLMAVTHLAVGVYLIVLFAAVVFLISLAISFLYPIFSRIGNKFVPLEDGELKERLMELLCKHGYKVKAIEVMDASRRTTKLNAYFTGFGKLKTIVLYDNLVNSMSTDEICAVFAHELGHGLNKDVLKAQIFNIFNMLIMGSAVLLAVSIPEFYTFFGFEAVNYGFAYIIVGLFLSLVQPLTGIVMNARSRAAEYRADRQAVKEGYGEPMISALKKLSKDNFAHPAPSRFIVVMEYSHPPLSQRLDAVEREMAKK